MSHVNVGGGTFGLTVLQYNIYISKNQTFMMNVKDTRNLSYDTGVEKTFMKYLEAV